MAPRSASNPRRCEQSLPGVNCLRVSPCTAKIVSPAWHRNLRAARARKAARRGASTLLQQARQLSHHGSSMPSNHSNWQCATWKAWSWSSRSVCRQCGKHWNSRANSPNGKSKKAVKRENRPEAAPLVAEEQLEDAPRERLVPILKELKGKSASLAIPQPMRDVVERSADQVRQRLRELDLMSLRMAKVQAAIGRAEEELRKKAAAAEQAERERHQAQQRRDQLVEDMRVLSWPTSEGWPGRTPWRARKTRTEMGGAPGMATRLLDTTGITTKPRWMLSRHWRSKSSSCRKL